MYRAPVEEIAFTLKHVAGLAGARPERLRRPRRRPRRRDPGRSRPLRQRGDCAALHDRRRQGAVLARRGGDHAARLEGTLSRAGSMAAGTRSPGRRNMAARDCRTCSASLRSKCGTAAAMAFGIGPTLTMGAVEALDKHGSEALKAHLSRQARLRRMDGHDEPDRAAGRLRPRRPAHPRRAGRRRHLPHLRAKDLHHLWRARFHRKHHSSGAGAAARRAARHARHLAVPGAEIPGRGRWRARRAQRCLLRRARAQARHPRLADLHHDLRRRLRRARTPGAIGWLVGEENAASPACSR